MSDYTELNIKSKKISELNNYNKNIVTDGDETYIVVAYTKNGAKENYKLSLSDLSSLISLDQRDIIIRNNLDNVIASDDNPTGIKRNDKNVVLNYKSWPGFYMPSSNLITVTGASYSYYSTGANAKSGYIIIESVNKSNDTGIINIRMHSGELIHYSLQINFEHINYTVIDNQLNHNNDYMTVGDSLYLRLTPDNGYVLPDDIEFENCEIEYKKSESYLIINCTKDSCEYNVNNMPIIINGAASNSKYYFGHFAPGIDDENIVTYAPRTIYGRTVQAPVGVTIDEDNLPSNIIKNNGFPAPINTFISLYDFSDTYMYGTGEVWILLPKTYLNIDTNNGKVNIIDDHNNELKIYTGTQELFSVNIDINYLFEFNIGEFQYAMFSIAHEGLYSNELKFKQSN